MNNTDSTHLPKTNELDIFNILFFSLVPLFSIIGLVLYLQHHSIAWQTWVLTITIVITAGLSITMGYHRLFSHRSYKAHWLLKVFFLIAGAAAFQESVIRWANNHRIHHAKTDTPEDPHAITKSFFHAHIGWLFYKTNMEALENSNCISDLRKDRLVVIQDKYYNLIALVTGIVIPACLGLLWNDFWGALILAVGIRITLVSHGTFSINSFAHLIGKKPYDKEITAVDNWFVSLFTFGEGYHNYHHAHPSDYRNGKKLYNFDPTKWLIFLFSKIGLTKDLRRST